MIYLDSSALMKLVRQEAETTDLIGLLDAQRTEHAGTSELGRIEVMRAARRAGPEAVAEAHTVIGDLDLVPLNSTVQDLACDIGVARLRTLDAIHLASAVLVRSALTAFVAYDHRLFDAAAALDLPAVAPGRTAPSPERHRR